MTFEKVNLSTIEIIIKNKIVTANEIYLIDCNTKLFYENWKSFDQKVQEIIDDNKGSQIKV